jgi:hypothetical protein
MKYIQAETPSTLWANKITYLCDDCATIWDVIMPIDNEFIKFVEKEGDEERWLPTYEKGGYLDLLEKLIPGFKKHNKITVHIADEFEKKFCNFQEPSSNGQIFLMNFRVRCPKCNSHSIIIRNIESVINPDISWMRYSPIFIE